MGLMLLGGENRYKIGDANGIYVELSGDPKLSE
jgi:hypothetical protein